VIPVVFDTGVIIADIGWRGPAHRALALVARRRCRMVVTEDIIAEYESRVPAVLTQEAPKCECVWRTNLGSGEGLVG
jgi:predicted nucleic acid-binding protein